MIKQLKTIIPFVLSLYVTVSCSAQDRSPTDQLIKGPIEITTKWKTITFDKPLQAAPYAQHIKLLSCNNEYDFIKVGSDEKRHFLIPHRFRRVIDKQIMEPEVIANDGKNEYHLFYSISGTYYNKALGDCIFIGYSLRGKGIMNLILPQDTKFVSMKIRANIPASIDHLYWFASGYDRYPNSTWEAIHPSKIIDMKSQALPPND